jgi:hypothetical protein
MPVLDIVGDHQFAHQRAAGAGGDRYVLALHQGQQAQRVMQGFLRRLVAGGGGDGFDVQF